MMHCMNTFNHSNIIIMRTSQSTRSPRWSQLEIDQLCQVTMWDTSMLFMEKLVDHNFYNRDHHAFKVKVNESEAYMISHNNNCPLDSNNFQPNLILCEWRNYKPLFQIDMHTEKYNILLASLWDILY